MVSNSQKCSLVFPYILESAKADLKSGLAGQNLADSAAMLSLDGVVLPLRKWI